MGKQKVFNILIISAIGLSFLFLNICQPIFADDFGRLSASALTRGNLGHIVFSQYMAWTGRISAEFLAYFLFNKDHILASLFIIDILNSIIFCIFTLLCFKIVTKDKYQLNSRQFICFLFYFCMIFLYSGVIGNALWKTAAIQYFWGIVLLLGYYYFIFQRQKDSLIFSIFTGIFIGLYNEIYVGVIVILSLAYFLDQKLNKNIINKNIVYFFIATVVGGIILFSAPGNYKRLDILTGSRDISLLQNIEFMWLLLLYHPYAKLLHYIVGGILILFFLSKNYKTSSKIIYFIALIISLFILTPVVGQYGGLNQRVLMIYYIIFFLVLLLLFYNSENNFVIKLGNALHKLFLILSILLVFQLSVIFEVYISLHSYDIQRQQLMNYYHKHDIKNAEFPINYKSYIDPNYKFIYFDDITFNKNDWRNKGFASYYRFDSVVLRK